jgi:DNA sulfur modification protein DndE
MKPAPRYDAGSPDQATHDVAFFTTLCSLLADNPPYERDKPIVELMNVLGLRPGATISPDSLDPDFRRGLVRAAEDGPSIIGWRVKYRGVKSPTYWGVDLRGGSYGTDYLSRAEGAVQGLFVHDAEECEYFHSYHDGNGELLNGTHTYQLHFAVDQVPPVKRFGFWSITAYTPMYLLIPNEFGRYSVQSSDSDLRFNDDGSLDIMVGPTPPSGGISNWIATTPDELFRLNMRVYLPDDPMRSPDSVHHFLPPIMRVGISD